MSGIFAFMSAALPQAEVKFTAYRSKGRGMLLIGALDLAGVTAALTTDYGGQPIGILIPIEMMVGAVFWVLAACIWVTARRTSRTRDNQLLRLTYLFMLAYGTARFSHILVYFMPRADVLLWAKTFTAITIGFVVVAVIWVLPKAMAIPDSKQLETDRDSLAELNIVQLEQYNHLENKHDLLAVQAKERAVMLAEIEARFVAVETANPDGVMLFDAVRDAHGAITDFEWVFTNPASERIVTRSNSELVGKRLLIEMPGNRDSGLFDAYKDVVENNVVWRNEFPYQSEGIDAWFHATAVKVNDGFAVMFQDITNRKENEAHVQLLMGEINHRSKNLLAVVQAIVRMTARESSGDDFSAKILSRLQSLSASQDLIVNNEWQSVPLEELVRTQLSHLGDMLDTRICIHGPHVSLRPDAAQAIGMAIHELSTNAIKYGSLSGKKGNVTLMWHMTGTDRFSLKWVEANGPPVLKVNRKGFGSIVMEAMAARQVNGDVTLNMAKSGLEWTLDAPISGILTSTVKAA